jgi:hypothetical protein
VGSQGVERTLLPRLHADEHTALKRSAEVIRDALGGRW